MPTDQPGTTPRSLAPAQAARAPIARRRAAGIAAPLLLAGFLATAPLASAPAQTAAPPADVEHWVSGVVITTATITIDGTKNCTNAPVDPLHTRRCSIPRVNFPGRFIGATIGELTGTTKSNAGEAEVNKTLGSYNPLIGGTVYISWNSAGNTGDQLRKVVWTFKLIIFSDSHGVHPGG